MNLPVGSVGCLFSSELAEANLTRVTFSLVGRPGGRAGVGRLIKRWELNKWCNIDHVAGNASRKRRNIICFVLSLCL